MLIKYPPGVYDFLMKKILIVLMAFYSFSIFAHPVIYKGGAVYQGTFMPMMHKMRVGYSLNSKFAVVANSNWFQEAGNYQDYTFGVNALLKRWLANDSQANVYTGFHAGQYKDDQGDGNVLSPFLMADWESRDHYTVFQTKGYIYDDQSNFDYTFRYGFAPFRAGMRDLQTWLILQAYYYKPQSSKLLVTPMIRFFYRNVLWEVGYSTRGQSYLTLMIHY